MWISGDNTYSGPTVVNAGVLHVMGTQPNSPVQVNGGTLGLNLVDDGSIRDLAEGEEGEL